MNREALTELASARIAHLEAKHDVEQQRGLARHGMRNTLHMAEYREYVLRCRHARAVAACDALPHTTTTAPKIAPPAAAANGTEPFDLLGHLTDRLGR